MAKATNTGVHRTRNMGCVGCHDPHMSVWKDKGGVKTISYTGEEHSIGNMCLNCHYDKRIRGSMGEIGMECIDCHMPESSAAGHRHTHLFRINTAPLDSANNWKEEKNDSNAVRKYWMNYDGTTGAGDSFITVDMACGECHQNRTMEQLSRAAKYIHREPGLVDLTINGGDNLQVVTKTKRLSVDFAVYPEEAAAEAPRRPTGTFCRRDPRVGRTGMASPGKRDCERGEGPGGRNQAERNECYVGRRVLYVLGADRFPNGRRVR